MQVLQSLHRPSSPKWCFVFKPFCSLRFRLLLGFKFHTNILEWLLSEAPDFAKRSADALHILSAYRHCVREAFESPWSSRSSTCSTYSLNRDDLVTTVLLEFLFVEMRSLSFNRQLTLFTFLNLQSATTSVVTFTFRLVRWSALHAFGARFIVAIVTCAERGHSNDLPAQALHIISMKFRTWTTASDDQRHNLIGLQDHLRWHSFDGLSISWRALLQQKIISKYDKLAGLISD